MKPIRAPYPLPGAHRLVLAALLVAVASPAVCALGAQSPAPSARGAQGRLDTSGRWSVVAPEGALAWFDLMADLRLPGAGAFPLVDVRRGATLPEAVDEDRDDND